MDIVEFRASDGTIKTAFQSPDGSRFIEIPSQQLRDIARRERDRARLLSGYLGNVVVDLGNGAGAKLTRGGLDQILSRHHRDFFGNRVTQQQNFFPDDFGVRDIENIVREARPALRATPDEAVRVTYRGQIFEVAAGTDGVIRHVVPTGTN